MGIRDDAEAISLRYMTGSLPMGPATVIAWAFIVTQIITELCTDDPLPYRSRLAVATMERWGMALPFTTTSPDEPRLFVGEQVTDLRKLFEDTWHTATMVRIFSPLVAMDTRDVDREQTEQVVQVLRTFCDEKTNWLDSIKVDASTQVACELHVFIALIGHTTKLMRVVLGEKDWATFRTMYDEGMAGLTQIRDLAEAPPQ